MMACGSPSTAPLRDTTRLTMTTPTIDSLRRSRTGPSSAGTSRRPSRNRRPTGASSMTAGSGAMRRISPSVSVNDGGDAHLARQLGLRLQVARLAVHGDDDLRPHPAVHLAQLVAPRMPGDVHQRLVVGEDIAAVAGEAVLDAPDGLLVAGNGARGKDDDVALVERDLRMLLLGDAGERGARLALAAGAQQHDLVAVEVGELVLVEVAEALRQVAGLDGDVDDAMQGAAGDDQLAARPPAPPRRRL